MKKLSLICAMLLLSACGSGYNAYDIAQPPAPPAPPTAPAPAPAPTPPVAMVDAFFTLVMSFLTPTTEDAEAREIDSVVATQPEDTEPVELT